MRILLVAYEFPPSPSPGALRWRFLVRELAALGHTVDVLAPRIAGSDASGLGHLDNVVIHRTFAGPFFGLVEWRSRRRAMRSPSSGFTPEASPREPRGGLNWKGKVLERMKSVAGRFMYPDIRAEWRPFARQAMSRLLERLQPDMVISAHEPATSLQVGILATKRNIPWVVDLGDPVLAPYTPERWRETALFVERQSCLAATHVVVTASAAKRMLMKRHALPAENISVLTQGFEDRIPPGEDNGDADFDPALLELLYVGRFYEFRRPHELIAGVLATQGVRLTIASPNLPDECIALAGERADRLRLLGPVSHERALALQRKADVLVNIGNDRMSDQVPGKLFEYLGAGKPILHLLAGGDAPDPSRELLDSLDAGWVCENRATDLTPVLTNMRSLKQLGTLHRTRVPAGTDVEAFGWTRIGSRYSELIGRLCACNERGSSLPEHPG